jgi:hypothetical protein
MDRDRRFMPGRNRSDGATRPRDDLAARENPFVRGREDRAVDRHQTPLGELDVGAGDHLGEHGRLADREDNHVCLDLGVVVTELRREPPGFVEDGQAFPQSHAANAPLVVGQHLFRAQGSTSR